MELNDLLAEMVKRNGSDLYISVGAPPQIKIEGKTFPLGKTQVDRRLAKLLAYEIMSEEQADTYERESELNKALDLSGVGRFRVNLFVQRGDPALVFRHIKDSVPTISELGLPLKLQELIMEPRGLVLLVGATGTGKSTTLASMVDYRSQQVTGHILTIEDPIEFIHSHKKSLVNQREIGFDTKSYSVALKNAMREAPDVILIGEIRDLETMQHALAYAETGHLCVSTLHANNANQAIDRILSFYPGHAHKQVMMDLSMNLKAVVSQRLCAGVENKRVPAVELMINTPYIADLIQKGKLEKIKDAMTQSKGMVHETFDASLYRLSTEGKISEEEALRQADSRNNLALKFRLDKGKHVAEGRSKREIAFNQKAPFEHYQTFRITPIKVNQEQRDDMRQVLDKALVNAFEQRGLNFSSDEADLDVQYIYGLEHHKELSLEALENENDQLVNIQPDCEDFSTLIINIRDTAYNKDIWRLNASQPVEVLTANEAHMRQQITDLVSDFPPQVH